MEEIIKNVLDTLVLISVILLVCDNYKLKNEVKYLKRLNKLNEVEHICKEVRQLIDDFIEEANDCLKDCKVKIEIDYDK